MRQSAWMSQSNLQLVMKIIFDIEYISVIYGDFFQNDTHVR